MSDKLPELRRRFKEELGSLSSLPRLEELRVEYFGKKGEITQLLKSVGELPPEQRRGFGAEVNALREELEGVLDQTKKTLEERAQKEALSSESVDIGLPGRRLPSGSLHPLTIIERKVIQIFRALGFSVATGPEVESDYYNFEALNFPSDHPARDMQDTLFLEDGYLLRTHTSPVQIRTMETKKPPLRVAIPGRVYRHDSDTTHSPVFHQVEGLCVGNEITFAHLKGTLEAFVHMMFGREIATRFRPSFFPFTEPSAEVDMACGSCKGKGCRVCKETGWIEILGCGMVDPNVFLKVGEAWTKRGEENPYDPEKISGFAWGMGIERIAMVLYGIDDIRLFYENDVRFLDQFRE